MWLLLLVGLMFIAYNLWPPPEMSDHSVEAPENVVSSLTNPSNFTSGDSQTASFTILQGYTGRGSVVRSQRLGQNTISISIALPALSEGGYYQAQLSGVGLITMGRLEVKSGTFKLDYQSTLDLADYDTITISVNGADFTVEENSRTLPFDIAVAKFN
jgi:hypothetical protein